MSALAGIFVAPRATFLALRAAPRGWLAALAVCALALLAALGELPASRHVLEATLATGGDPNAAALAPADRAQVAQLATRAQWALLALAPLAALVAIGFGTLVFLVAAAASGEPAQPHRSFALAAHVALVRLGVGALAATAIVLGRGATDFATQHALTIALPSLAWFVPATAPRVSAILATVNPFQVWTLGLAIVGATTVLGVRRPIAIAAALVLVAPEALVAAVAGK